MENSEPSFNVVNELPASESARIADTVSEPAETKKPRKKRGPNKNKKSKVAQETAAINHATATIANRIFFSTMQAIGGEDAGPTEQEATDLDAALAEFLSTTSVQIPPGALLAGLYVNYAATKITKPTVREKLQITGAWLQIKMGNILPRLKFWKRKAK